MIRRPLEILNFGLFAFTIAAPVLAHAHCSFSMRFSLAMLRYRQRVWKVRSSEFEVRMEQVYSVIIGTVFLIGGLIVAAQLVF